MEKTFMEAMDFRHACKIFDETKKVSDEDINYILEAGRKSPSSFGMEPWKFLVITNEELKAKIRPFCWDQVQVTSCSHLVVILAAIESVKPESGVPAKRFARREMPQDKKDFYNNLYKNHLTVTNVLQNDEQVFAWTARQTYIPMANMMTAAAIRGIDSCPNELGDFLPTSKIYFISSSLIFFVSSNTLQACLKSIASINVFSIIFSLFIN